VVLRIRLLLAAASSLGWHFLFSFQKAESSLMSEELLFTLKNEGKNPFKKIFRPFSPFF